MSKKKKVLFALLVLIPLLALWDAWLIHFHVPRWEPLFVSTSPDGRFAVSVYSNPGVLPRGSIGTVVLRDTRTGKVLMRERVESVTGSDPHVDWFPERNRVLVISVGAWDLPID